MSYDLHIVRTEDWLEAENNPILKEDLEKLILSDKELDWSKSDYVDIAEENGEIVRYFGILWRNSPVFLWKKNEITCSNPDEDQVMKMIEMADKLKAKVIGDDREAYRIKKGFLGKKKLITE